MPCNHWGLLINHHTGKPFPMVTVGDFCQEDKIFLGTPGDSLLFNGNELARLQRESCVVATSKEEKSSAIGTQKEKWPSSHGAIDALSSSCKKAKHPESHSKSPETSSRVPQGSPRKKSSFCCSKHSPPSKEQQDKHDKDSHNSSSKHKDKPHSDKSSRHSTNKGSRSPHKCPLSPQWPSST